MSKRWLSSVLIFALGCASLVANAVAQEPPEESGVLEDGLSYVITENEFRLVNTGKDVYLVMVQREPGIVPAEGPVSYMEGTVRLSGYGLSKAIAYRLEPIAVLADQLWRTCAMGDCSWTGPFPPPPPPSGPPDPAAVFVQPVSELEKELEKELEEEIAVPQVMGNN